MIKEENDREQLFAYCKGCPELLKPLVREEKKQVPGCFPSRSKSSLGEERVKAPMLFLPHQTTPVPVGDFQREIMGLGGRGRTVVELSDDLFTGNWEAPRLCSLTVTGIF